ncbi:glycosyltransferase family 2 protein [Oscillochloris sp. ZM17-4]|uniref:glycosyltransferase family 2 protein n=1 Tax=Oscillochloris sp. ZM17-4 TaxID=2866714 RepID=UPI001C73C4B0|nr:glycosyltransferase family 2 protein [Oscillochloris sp. ZM17-4]MBX0327755.1 glycosyltransferase family 2 protein [Oscillochloris sp. ZM17-4]
MIAQRPTAPSVYLVVLNWNGYADTHECLESLRGLAYPNYRIIVVDNASSDDSPGRIADAHPDAEMVRCAQNLGIAAGYNAGIRLALQRGADYVVPMNNDLDCDPMFVSQMVATARAAPGCGVVMPKIFYYEERDRIWSAGAYARWMPSNIVMRGRQQPDGPAFAADVEIQFAPSCCLLITRDLAERVAFDEGYFFYYDDWDFCVEARKAGYRVIYSAGARLWHKVSRSTKNSPKSTRWWTVFGQSCVRYHRKHHDLRVLMIYVAWVLLRETVKGNVRSLPSFLAGVRTALGADLSDDLRPAWRS